MVMSLQGNERYLTTREASKALGFAEDTVRRYINDGLIKASMFGNSWAVPLSEVERYKREKRPVGRPPKKSSK